MKITNHFLLASRPTIIYALGFITLFTLFVLIIISGVSLTPFNAGLGAMVIFGVAMFIVLKKKNPGLTLAETVQKFLTTLGAKPINSKSDFDPPEEGLFTDVDVDVLTSYTQLQTNSQTINFSYGEIHIPPHGYEFLYFLQTKLKSQLPGSIQLRPRRSKFVEQLVSPVKTESVQVNEELDLIAYPKKLAFQVFPPDFLDWYMALPVRPWIIARNDKITVVYEGAKDLQHIAKTMEWFKAIIKRIERSGALEKNTKTS